MKIFLDIGHPAHVHYFRNFVRIMQSNGHEFFVTARDKEVVHTLLAHYGIPFYNRGKGADNLVGKFLYIFKAGLSLLGKALQFKPDLFVSFASPYAAHVAWLLRKPHIVLDDTEGASLNHWLYVPFSKVMLNPVGFKKRFGRRQIQFNSFMELSYLHPKYFKPDPQIFSLLGLQNGEPYAILRFVSWHANHDVRHKGLSEKDKRLIVQELIPEMKVFISSEGELPADLKKYKLTIPPYRLHDALNFAQIYIGEGATTASECAMLGTPAIYINSQSAGTLEEQQARGLVHLLPNARNLIQTIDSILGNPMYENNLQVQRQKMLEEKIDVTGFLVSFIKNYPHSFQQIHFNKK